MHRLLSVFVGAIAVAVLGTPARAAEPATPAHTPSPDVILHAQVALDRAAFSVGEIDGRWGANTERALRAFQQAHTLAATGAASGTLDDATRAALGASGEPALVPYTLTDADVAGPFAAMPADMMDKAKVPAAGYASALEAIAERVHASPKLLTELNPDERFDRAGAIVTVPNVRVGPQAPAARIVVDGTDLAVRVLDDAGKVIARYPASVGSEHDPLPIGSWKIKGVARNPPFRYDPKLFWDAKASHDAATIPPGPNNPVGVVWIDLSKDHYGIHGTPEPSRIARSESHGCIRVTNWDATALAEQVRPGTPVVLQR